MSMSAIAARAAALLLTNEKGRKGVGFLLVAIFAPVILIAAILCSTTSGGADHNNLAVEASFYGTSSRIPYLLSSKRTSRICRLLFYFWIKRWQRPTQL